MGCGNGFMKYSMFVVNLIFALGGLVLLGLGIAVQLQVKVVTDLLGDSFTLAPIATIVLGCVAFVIAFCGCCGAIRQSGCLLVFYSVLMIILMILTLALSIVIFVALPNLPEGVNEWLTDGFNAANREPFHNVETSLKCCGITGPNSYGNIAVLPSSCCPTNINVCNNANAYSTGCAPALTEFLDQFGIIIGAIGIVITVVMLIGVIFALCLNSNRRSGKGNTV